MSTPLSNAGNSLPRRSKPAIVTILSRRDKRKGGLPGCFRPAGAKYPSLASLRPRARGSGPTRPAMRMARLAAAPRRRGFQDMPPFRPSRAWPASPNPPKDANREGMLTPGWLRPAVQNAQTTGRKSVPHRPESSTREAAGSGGGS